jgi:hypothetical protein
VATLYRRVGRSNLSELNVAAVRAGVYFLQSAAKRGVVTCIFHAVVDLHRVMIHHMATLATDHWWFFLGHSEMFSRP